MRPLEILLTAANVLLFAGVSVQRFRQVQAIRYTGIAALAIAAVQLLAEGPRWQMIPGYAVDFAFAAVAMRRRVVPSPKKSDRGLAGRLPAFGAKTVGSILLLISIALPTLLPVFHMAPLTGPYQIGTLTYHWVDSTRREIFAKNPQDRRQLMAQVWYPVAGDESSMRAPYLDDADAMSAGLTHALSASGLLKLPSFFFDYFRYVHTHAIPSAPVSAGKSPFPVLLYLTGLDGFRQASMFQVENSVSHGYIVVGLDEPYTAAAVKLPDGRVIYGLSKKDIQPLIDQSIDPAMTAPALNGTPLTYGIIPYLAEDVVFAINRLTAIDSTESDGALLGRLDMNRVGVFGVSLGAMVAAEACHEDPRIAACLMMDAAMPADVVKAGLRQPAMWLTRPASDMRLERARSGGWSEKDISQTLSTMRDVYMKEKNGAGYYVSISGMFHVNFTDAPYWFPFGSQLGLTGPIDGHRGFDVVNAYSIAFFDKSLKGKDSPLLAGPSKLYPEAAIAIH